MAEEINRRACRVPPSRFCGNELILRFSMESTSVAVRDAPAGDIGGTNPIINRIERCAVAWSSLSRRSAVLAKRTNLVFLNEINMSPPMTRAPVYYGDYLQVDRL